MDNCKSSCKPRILCHGGIRSSHQRPRIELVPFFLEANIKNAEYESNTAFDSHYSNKETADFEDDFKHDTSDHYLDSFSFDEIIVTIDDNINYLDTDVEFDNDAVVHKLVNETEQVPEERIATPVPTKIKEAYNCAELNCDSEPFSSYRIFRDHYLSNHGKFPLECLICGKRYKEKHSLQNHLEMHKGEENYPCNVCFKKFRTKERMLVHRQLHEGRRFECNCGFKARCQRSLRKHQVMKHGQRKFECSNCSKMFASRQNLEAHKRIHTGETPWDCKLCNSKFNRQHHFRQHLSTNMHLKKINDLVAVGGEIPDEINPEKNIPKKREILDISQ